MFRHYGLALREQMQRVPIKGAVEILELSERAKHAASVPRVCGRAQALQLDGHAVLVAFECGRIAEVWSEVDAFGRKRQLAGP